LDSRRVIVALDFPDAGAALAAAARLDPALCRVKVGKELFVAAGPAIVGQLRERGFEVFLDLKFHDIPNTVAGACRAAARLGVWMLNVHASGGSAMMRAAREAVAEFPRPPLLIGVTVLTSLSDAALGEVGLSGGAAANVERLARLAAASGLDGVVCSAEEAVRRGAHYLVIGRPVTQAADPASTLQAIVRSLGSEKARP
jgi:orotidine-5'-phosphate decarboxylase